MADLIPKRIYDYDAIIAAITGYEFILDKNGIPSALKVSFDDLNALIIHDNLKDIDAGATYLHLDSDEKGLVQALDAQVVANVATLPASGDTSLLYYAIAEQLLKYWDGVNYQDIIDFNNVAKKNAANTFTELNIFDHVGDKKAAIQIGDLTTVSSITGVYGRTTTEMWVSGATGAEVVVGQSAGAIELARFKSAGLEVAGYVAPSTDNTKTCGTASLRFSEVFAGNGTINTSDARLKTEVLPFTQDEKNAAQQMKAEIGTFFWKDGTRKHIGLTVQRAIEIMKYNNLDVSDFSSKYSFICYNKWDEETKVVQVPITETLNIQEKEIVLDNGKYVEKINTVSKDVQKSETHKLHNEKGEIIREIKIPLFEKKTIVTKAAGDVYSFRFNELILFIMGAL